MEEDMLDKGKMFGFYVDTLKMTGYEPKTSFWWDFSIAEKFGIEAIKETYARTFEEWKDNFIYLTELVMILNWKMWAWHEFENEELMRAYCEIWEDADNYARKNLTGEEIRYYFRTID